MKIIQLIYTLCSGGAEKFVVDLSNQLTNIGHEVTICMLLDDTIEQNIFNGQFINPKVRIHSMRFSAGFSLRKCHLVHAHIKQMAPDVVHCHLNVIPYIYKLALTNRKIKFFHTLHNIAEKASGAGVQYFLNRFFYKYSLIKPVCISRLCMESYRKHYKLDAPYVDNGRTMIGKSPMFDKTNAEIDAYKSTKDTKVFIHVARFNEQKNQRLLIDAFNQLAKSKLNFILLVIGNGYDCMDGRKLQSEACDKIRFLGEKNNVNDYLLCSDAFCLTSRFEGLPISLIEALSCGVTPICTPVGGIPDVITDGYNGYLADGQSVEEYVDAVNKFVNQPIQRQLLIDYYQSKYSMEGCALSYVKLYKACQ